MEIKALQKRIETITDPRRVSHGNIRHRLDDIIIIGLCTIICLGEDYNDMEAFGVERGMAEDISGITEWNTRQQHIPPCIRASGPQRVVRLPVGLAEYRTRKARHRRD